jgi:uncharacterized protein YkwD
VRPAENKEVRMVRWFLWVIGLFFGPDQPNRPPQPPPPPSPPPPVPDPTAAVMVMLRQHNEARTVRGARALALDGRCSLAAQRHADWMAQNRDLDHTERPDTPGYDAVTFADRLRDAGYLFGSAGENVSAGQASPEEVLRAWLGSPPHRQNILDPAYWHAGFGLARDEYGSLYWCAVYAAPLPRLIRRAVVRVHLPPALVKRG